MLSAGIIGGTGLTASELLRLLARHPDVEVEYITSRTRAGQPVWQVHPHMRGLSKLRFTSHEDIPEVDVLFLCLPHSKSMSMVSEFESKAGLIVDLSADFRLSSPEDYEEWYGEEHTAPELVEHFVYGLPEVSREALAGARYIAAPGCTATAGIFALAPFIAADQVDISRVTLDAKVGSSAAGASPGDSGAHLNRVGIVRPYAPAGHRHAAEVCMVMNSLSEGFESRNLKYTAHATDMVRGILQTGHMWLKPEVTFDDAKRALRQYWRGEPFVTVLSPINTPRGMPEPRLVSTTNQVHVGLAYDQRCHAITSFAAIDNLVKGAAGSAIQSMNLALGFEETMGLNDNLVWP